MPSLQELPTELFISIEDNSLLTPGIVDIILASGAAETLSDLHIMSVDAFTPANVLRLAHGCPKLVDLIWYGNGGLRPLADGNGQNVDDLIELLESRGKRKPGRDIRLFTRLGPETRAISLFRSES